MELSNRIKKLSPSATLSLDSQVKLLQSKGESVINLTIGEPDFETPKNIKRAAIKAINEGFTHYTPSAGIMGLRSAVQHKLKTENKIKYSENEIVVGVGTKQLLHSIFQVICNRGDEVIIFTPTWSTYVEQIKLAEAKPILINLSTPFLPSAKLLAGKITNKTKAVILNYPCNPTGAVINESELKKIGNLATKHNFFIVSDEIYENIVYGKKHISIASISDEIKKHVITINGFSKSYAMTGWRVGYAAGPKDVIKGIVDLNSQTTSGTSSISQKAAQEAYENKNKSSVYKMTKEFTKRRNFLVSEMSKMTLIEAEPRAIRTMRHPELVEGSLVNDAKRRAIKPKKLLIKGIEFLPPDGAFYLFINLKKILRKGESSGDFCQELLFQAKVAIVPGEAFAANGYARISFASSMKNLKEGVKRINEFINDRNP